MTYVEGTADGIQGLYDGLVNACLNNGYRSRQDSDGITVLIRAPVSGDVDSYNDPSSGDSYITDDSVNWETDEWVGHTLEIEDDVGSLYTRQINSNNSTTLYFTEDLGTITPTYYWIWHYPFVRVQYETVTSEEDTYYRLRILTRLQVDPGGNEAPHENMIACPVDERDRLMDINIQFPVTYRAFIFEGEVFYVVGPYDERFEWLAFGQEAKFGLPGTGVWMAATFGGSNHCYGGCGGPFSIHPGGGGDNCYSYRAPATTPALFWCDYYYASSVDDPSTQINGFIHHALSDSEWVQGEGGYDYPIGANYFVELNNTQPNDYNLESVFIPIKAFHKRPDNFISQVLEVKNARHVRIDNYAPTQMVTMGNEQWMVFPYYRKYLDQKDGGNQINHTGTFGMAIRYA